MLGRMHSVKALGVYIYAEIHTQEDMHGAWHVERRHAGMWQDTIVSGASCASSVHASPMALLLLYASSSWPTCKQKATVVVEHHLSLIAAA